MTSEIIGRKAILKLIVFVAAVALGCYLVFREAYGYMLLLLPLLIYQAADLYRSQVRVHEELDQFSQAVRYRDFSRHFSVAGNTAEVTHMRARFNQIIVSLKAISKEKETQYQYLQKTLELINTGILSYREPAGEIVWMNEAFRELSKIPYLKNIHALAKRDENLYAELMSLKPGSTRVAALRTGNSELKVLLSAASFRTEGNSFKLIAFQNANEALDETESKAWQRLLKVLTHEIMNSVAPITSLAETLKKRLHESQDSADIDPSLYEDLDLGIDTIRRRSDSLLRFAETYRQLNRIINLQLSRVLVRDLFSNLLQLMQPTFEQKNIEVDIVLTPTDLELEADVHLVEQVLLNLIVNAIDAVKESAHPAITLFAQKDQHNRTLVRVTDNGTGIPEEVADKIFIPFFSTKKTGSGIGLSLCKQIMILHKGNIQVHSEPGEGSVFTLQF